MYQPSVFRRDDRFVSLPPADRRSGPVLGALAMLLAGLVSFTGIMASRGLSQPADAGVMSSLQLMGP